MFSFTYNDSDISLSERKNLLDLSDEKLCMNDCNNTNFDIKTLRSICQCKINKIIGNNDNYLSENKGKTDINQDKKDLFNINKKN